MFFLDQGYTYIFENGEPRTKIQNILQLKNKHYDVAFFGSSRTENHIDCKLITELTGKSCINFGITGSSPGDMLILMKLAKNRKITFNHVFMQVDYNFNSYVITEHFKANIIGPLIANPIVKQQLYKYNEDYIYRRIPFYYYMKFDKNIGIRELTASFLKVKPNVQRLEIGFSPLPEIGKAVAGSFPETIKDKSQELNQMKELYKNTNTRLEFFTAPYCKEVKNRNFIEKVQLKLPGLHNYIDLFDDKDEYFFNCGHLNEVGAKLFTKIIIEDMLQ
jgi:hypothetical protein